MPALAHSATTTALSASFPASKDSFAAQVPTPATLQSSYTSDIKEDQSNRLCLFVSADLKVELCRKSYVKMVTLQGTNTLVVVIMRFNLELE
ncbi:hypothetical protein C8J56DRAFT_1065415 [Mycena floridula]|nr:hypothetical protein C8J56DRAFT_1065415 [Mycena floridula]